METIIFDDGPSDPPRYGDIANRELVFRKKAVVVGHESHSAMEGKFIFSELQLDRRMGGENNEAERQKLPQTSKKSWACTLPCPAPNNSLKNKAASLDTHLAQVMAKYHSCGWE